MKNSADLGGCYPPRPSASVDNTLLDLQNSSYPSQPHSIIAKYLLLKLFFNFFTFCFDFAFNKFNQSFLFIFLVQLTGDEHNEETLANLAGNLA